MKKLFTLAAAGVLAAGTLSAQAQVTLDGQLTAAEVTAGNYVLLGKFTNPRGFGDWGLLSLYAASTANKLYFFVGGTVEAKSGSQGNSFQLFMNLPGLTGVPAGTALPAGTTTTFTGMTAKMELETDLALALTQDGTDWQVEAAAYTSATAGTSKKLTSTAGVLTGTGAPQTLAATATVGAIFEKLAGARVAYKNTTDGKVTSNPGNVTPNTDPTYGGVGSYGWEIEIDRATAGLTGTPNIQVFALQNNDNGSYLSTDFIPQTSAPNGNLANASSVDFTTIAGRQYTGITLGANGVLGTQTAAAAAMGLTVAPNPVAGRATISYNVANSSEQVRIALTDLLGREVRVLENGSKAAGTQTLNLSTTGLAAGTYLVKVQQAGTTATRKVVLL